MIVVKQLSFVLAVTKRPVAVYEFFDKAFLYTDGKMSTILYCPKEDAEKIKTICTACGYDAQYCPKPEYIKEPWCVKEQRDYTFIVLVGFDYNKIPLSLQIRTEIW